MISPFNLNKDGQIEFREEALMLCPELSGLKEKEINFVIYAVDYRNSPARMKPPEERIREAKIKFFGKDTIKVEENPIIKSAMEAYHGLIFDVRRETIDIYKRKISMIHRELLSAEVSYTRLKEINQSIEFLNSKIESLEREVDIERQLVEMKKGKKMSFIEQWQMNMVKYKEFRGMIQTV